MARQGAKHLGGGNLGYRRNALGAKQQKGKEAYWEPAYTEANIWYQVT